MTQPRIMRAATMDLRDLSRRRVAMGLLLLLPLVFYGSASAGEGSFVLQVGGLGVAWAVVGAGVFLALGNRRLVPRLLLAGYRSTELAASQLLLLAALSVPIAAAFAAVVASLEDMEEPATFLLAVMVTALISVPLGLVIGAVAPSELEGTLGLIGVLGMQMSLPADAAAGAALPLYGPVQLIEQAYSGNAPTDPAAALLHAAVAGTLLVALALILARRR